MDLAVKMPFSSVFSLISKEERMFSNHQPINHSQTYTWLPAQNLICLIQTSGRRELKILHITASGNMWRLHCFLLSILHRALEGEINPYKILWKWDFFPLFYFFNDLGNSASTAKCHLTLFWKRKSLSGK